MCVCVCVTCSVLTGMCLTLFIIKYSYTLFFQGILNYSRVQETGESQTIVSSMFNLFHHHAHARPHTNIKTLQNKTRTRTLQCFKEVKTARGSVEISKRASRPHDDTQSLLRSPSIQTHTHTISITFCGSLNPFKHTQTCAHTQAPRSQPIHIKQSVSWRFVEGNYISSCPSIKSAGRIDKSEHLSVETCWLSLSHSPSSFSSPSPPLSDFQGKRPHQQWWWQGDTGCAARQAG